MLSTDQQNAAWQAAIAARPVTTRIPYAPNTLRDGDVLMYDATPRKWVNIPLLTLLGQRFGFTGGEAGTLPSDFIAMIDLGGA